jgi:putative oxidoreductase
MQNPLGRFTDPFHAALRVMAGFMFAQHGAQKLFGLLEGHQATTAKMLTAGAIEFFGGILILLGLFTVPAAFLASGLMAFAYFMSHAPRGFWTVINKGELAVLYCFLFLFFAAYGGGKYSLDALFFRKKDGAAGA